MIIAVRSLETGRATSQDVEGKMVNSNTVLSIAMPIKIVIELSPTWASLKNKDNKYTNEVHKKIGQPFISVMYYICMS